MTALAALGNDVAAYNLNDRLDWCSRVLLPDDEPGPGGQVTYSPALDPGQAILRAMEGLSHALYTFGPSVVVFISAFYVRAVMLQVIRAHGHKVVIIHTESPYQDDEQLMRAPFADLNIVNDPVNLADFQALAPSVYLPHAYDPDVHYPNAGAPPATDFAFIGTMYDSRRAFFEEMGLAGMGLRAVLGGAGFDEPHMTGSPLLELLGHDPRQCVGNDDTAHAYRGTRASLNFYRREGEAAHAGEGTAMGPREVELAACGVPFLRDARPESDALLPFLPTFSGPADARDKLAWLLADEDRRIMLGRRAQRAVAPRTFRANAAAMLTELERAS